MVQFVIKTNPVVVATLLHSQPMGLVNAAYVVGIGRWDEVTRYDRHDDAVDALQLVQPSTVRFYDLMICEEGIN